MAEKQTATDTEQKLNQLTEAVAKLATIIADQATARPDSERLAEVMADGLGKANQMARKWYDEASYPDKSCLNPLGELDHPRPRFIRDTFLLNYHCQESQHTAGEINALNSLTPGEFHLFDDAGGIVREKFIKVTEINPGSALSGIRIEFPCKTDEDRLLLARYNRGRGIVDFLLLSALRQAPQPEAAVA